MTNTAETKSSNSALPKGEISGVNGPVVDVAFQKDSLPRIREALPAGAEPDAAVSSRGVRLPKLSVAAMHTTGDF